MAPDAGTVPSDRRRGLAWLLSLAGAIPFVTAALAQWLLPGHGFSQWAGQAALLYGAIILAFLGGIHWGFGLQADSDAARRLAVSVLPALLGWLALLVQPGIGLLLLLAGFLGQFVTDLWLGLPRWFAWLRATITVIVLASLGLLAVIAWQ